MTGSTPCYIFTFSCYGKAYDLVKYIWHLLLFCLQCFMLVDFVHNPCLSVSAHASNLYICSLFFKQEMELSLIGLQNAGKTSLVNVVAVSKLICVP